MTQKTAVVTGVSGQDGSYLAELLLSKNYKVVGIVRRSAMEDKKLYNIEHLLNNEKVIFYIITFDCLWLRKTCRFSNRQ